LDEKFYFIDVQFFRDRHTLCASPHMRHLIQHAVRHLTRNTTASVMSVIGLTIGFMAFLVIMLYVTHETSFDTWDRHPEEVYRVVKNFVNPNGEQIPDATTPPALAPALRKDLPEVAFATRFLPAWGRKYLIQYGENSFYESSLLRVDSSFFDVFACPFVLGNRETALRDVHSIVLTEATAHKYFGMADPIGKRLRINVNNGTDYQVTAVVKDIPGTSHFSFDFLVPLSAPNRDLSGDWQWYIFYTYIRLRPGADPAVFQAKLQPLFSKYQPESLNRYYAQALTAIHLNSNLKWELGTNSSWSYIRTLIAIALAILLIASVNYINMVTAQATRRGKDVGVRKIIGASRYSLIFQFLAESAILTTLSFVIAWIGMTLILPFTRSFTGYELTLYPVGAMPILVFAGSVPFIIIVAGIYPAIYLSSSKPVKVLKGNDFLPARRERLRQSLVVFQFLVSALLIAGTLVIGRQLDFIRHKELGFDKENVLLLPNVRGAANPEALAGDLRSLPQVKSIGRADGGLDGETATNGISTSYLQNHISLSFFRVDDGFIPTLGIALHAGRNFSKQFATDSSAIILNRTAIRELGLKPPFIGQRVMWDDDSTKTHPLTIIGVANDFNFSSLHESIRPFGFVYEKANGSNFFLKLSGEAPITSTLAAIGKVWKAHNPDKPFTYSFQDEQVARLYEADRKFERIFLFSSLLAIAIACLGLYGLTIYITRSRIKEIGIRKVLGSTVGQVVWLLSRRFLTLALVAFAIAIPVAWYGMNRWLGIFAYRTSIPWWIFGMTGILTLGIVLITVSFQSVGAALTNPAKSLRTD
jgi:putative ABC transport system permease protein